VGKAILAWQPDDLIDGLDLEVRTKHTIADPARLRAELAGVRRRGYAVDDRENEPEVRCVGAPVFNHTDTVVAAISVSGLTSRITAARVRELGPMVAAAASRISRKLGSATR
jgi:DNA-binding IclR family transcriptional regulator